MAVTEPNKTVTHKFERKGKKRAMLKYATMIATSKTSTSGIVRRPIVR